MSSVYSSHTSSPRCRRCGASLALNSPRCPNCGYVHQGNDVAQQQQAQTAWNNFLPPGFYEQNNPAQQGQQNSGLLKRYSGQPESQNSYKQQAPLSPSQQPQEGLHPIPPRASSNSTPSQAMQQNRGGHPYQGNNQHAPQSYPSNMAQVPGPYNSPNGPGMPPTNFRTPSQQLPPAHVQTMRSSTHNATKRQRFGAGRVVGVAALLLLLIGGSFLAYTFLFAHKAARQTTSGTTATGAITKPIATPQGTPMFQDEFANNTHGWSIQSYPGEFAVALGSGALRLESNNNKLLWELVPGDKKYADFELSVDAVLSKGSQNDGYGVYIRSGQSGNAALTSFYRLELYGDGSFAVFKGMTDANGALTTPRLVDYTNNSAIQKQGGLNHINITAKGSSLQFMVNGQVLSTVSDATYTSGSIALFVSNLQKATPGATATFSHLGIYSA